MSTADNNAGAGQPCANEECGFAGHAGFDNYCSVCYKGRMNEASAQVEAKMEVCKEEHKQERQDELKEISAKPEKAEAGAEAAGEDADKTPEKKKQKNRKRCFECKKKVGILGFECRCGFVYCGKHRYPEEHECDFDHATHDKERLANSVKKAVAKKVDVL